MKCKHNGCKADARYLPEIKVPATGWPIDTHRPLGMLFGLPVCHRHIKLLQPADLMTPELKDAMTKIANGRYLVPPDFDRAYISKVDIWSKDAREFLRRKRMLH